MDSISQNTNLMLDTLKTIFINRTNELNIKVDNIIRNKSYEDILEKTNNQLSLWLNPSALLIDTLGVLFSIGAIAVAIILFRQSREYRKTLDEFWDKKGKDLDVFMSDRNKNIERIESEFKKKVEEFEIKINKLSTANTAESKGDLENIKNELMDLKREKYSFTYPDPGFNIGTALSAAPNVFPLPIMTVCSNQKCRHVFYGEKGIGTGAIICPKCQYINI